MSTDTPARLEARATDDRCIDLSNDRAVSALTSKMSVLPAAPDVYTVVSESGREYTVDVRDGVCECPDSTYRGGECKHQIRALVATGRLSIPSWADRSAIDPQLGAHVPETPRIAAVDGGAVVGGETADVPEERPDECECRGADDVCACWPCYAAGYDFADPNPDAGDEDDEETEGPA